MSTWLDPLRAALDQVEEPTTWFFRDDDAGWADQHLYQLLDCFAAFDIPIDLAIIPTELRDGLVETLRQRHSTNSNKLGFHQHGFSHTNHEREGRKCEFGVSRSVAQQRGDIARGADLLREKLGSALDPIFTPPWNRCSVATVSALLGVGFCALSRDASSAPLPTEKLIELPVNIDWTKHHRDGAIGKALAAAAGSPRVGVMLHHAVMEPADLSALRELLKLIGEHGNVNCMPMRDLIKNEKQS